MASVHRICTQCDSPADQTCDKCSSADHILPICTMCNHGAEIQCAYCKSVFYCSVECKKADFPIHALLCEPHTRFQPRPSPNHRQAIHFPVQGFPESVWIECSMDINTNEAVAKTDHYFKSNRVQKFLDVNHLRRRRLNPDIMVYSNHSQLYSLPPNVNIRSLAAQQTSAFANRDWWGPVIVMGLRTSQRFIESFEDLTLEHLRDVIDYICVRGVTVPRLPIGTPFSTLPKANGVKITCAGDRACLNHDVSNYAYSSFVAYPLHDPVYIWGQVSPISALIGIPVLMLKTGIDHNPADPAHKVKNHVNVCSNDQASILQLIVDPQMNPPIWGTVQPQWQQKIGNVILVRQDGRDLMPQHGEALVDYARMVLRRIQSVANGSATQIDRYNITTAINHGDFTKFYEELVEEREMVDSNWMEVRSPF